MQAATNSKPSIIIVSGRSGSGKTSVLHILEDCGYYVIDNLPLSLLVGAVGQLTADSHVAKIALGVDARVAEADLSDFEQVHEALVQDYGEHCVKVLYVTASESVLVARFGATRRIHPLIMTQVADSLPEAIHQETALLEPIARLADVSIDTSLINTHELKVKVRDYLGLDATLTINLLSFGFKYGTPIDADFVFDVRVLPNPHWQPALRAKTGEDVAVCEFFAQFAEVGKMAGDIADFLIRWLPNFAGSNRHSVTIAIGCTGGKHRSVYVLNKVKRQLANHLADTAHIISKHRERRLWHS